MTPDIINVGAIFSELLSPEAIRNLIDRTEFNGATGCWIDKGSPSDRYSSLVVEGRKESTHRIVAFLMYDYKLNSGLYVCHERFCTSSKCWNWSHLYIGTSEENVQDAVILGRHRSVIGKAKTHCPRGHEYTPENTKLQFNARYQSTTRSCRECQRLRNDKNHAEERRTKTYIRSGFAKRQRIIADKGIK